MTAFGLAKWSFVLFAGAGSLFIGLRWLVVRKVGLLSKLYLVGVALATVVVINAFLIEPYWIQVSKVKIHDSELAQVVGDTKIVHIADIHLTKGIGFREKSLVKKVNALNPDIILFSGDLVDDLTQIPVARDLISRFKSTFGVLAIPGDTDLIVMDPRSFKREFQASNFRVLSNEAVPVRLNNGRILWIGGVDGTKGYKTSVQAAAMSIPRDAPYILFGSPPALFDHAAAEDANLLLVGDTHGGQVGIDFLIRMSDYANRSPYMRGLFEKGNTKMYVNRGIGTKTLPIRFLCRPEIALLEFVK